MLDAYLLPAKHNEVRRAGYPPGPSFGSTPLRDLSDAKLKAWYDKLPYGRTAERTVRS